jgi:peptidoglycan/xylan/chitin deacetylase (PgdA/CDA1 family)
MTDKARFLLRFDDICPTMNWEIWAEIENILLEKKVKPILAVVPDNQDPLLMVDDPVPDFWERVRAWQSRGWTIAMHGYQHKYVTTRKGIMGINPFSEFAGLSSAEQEDKLSRGVEILRNKGIEPAVFVAPAHSFDKITLRILPKYGLRIISDGFTRFPFTSREGLFWIPQQLWKFVPKSSGIWTVCIHHNDWNNGKLLEFARSLDRFQGKISCAEEVVRHYSSRKQTFNDRLFAWYYFASRMVIKKRTSQLIKKCFPENITNTLEMV